MAFNIGLSGVDASQAQLDVTSNNSANAIRLNRAGMLTYVDENVIKRASCDHGRTYPIGQKNLQLFLVLMVSNFIRKTNVMVKRPFYRFDSTDRFKAG